MSLRNYAKLVEFITFCILYLEFSIQDVVDSRYVVDRYVPVDHVLCRRDDRPQYSSDFSLGWRIHGPGLGLTPTLLPLAVSSVFSRHRTRCSGLVSHQELRARPTYFYVKCYLVFLLGNLRPWILLFCPQNLLVSNLGSIFDLEYFYYIVVMKSTAYHAIQWHRIQSKPILPWKLSNTP